MAFVVLLSAFVNIYLTRRGQVAIAEVIYFYKCRPSFQRTGDLD